jgi:hypothetical protein
MSSVLTKCGLKVKTLLGDPVLAGVALLSQGLVTSMYYRVSPEDTSKSTFLLGGLAVGSLLATTSLTTGAAEGVGKVLLFVGVPNVVQASLCCNVIYSILLEISR